MGAFGGRVVVAVRQDAHGLALRILELAVPERPEEGDEPPSAEQKRDRDEDTGEYSNIMHVEIDKNTMGATGAFDQIMEPKFFRLTDIYREPLNK